MRRYVAFTGKQARLLVVPKTTLFDAVTAFAAKAQLETVSLELAQDVELEIWLARCLRAARESPGDRQHRICVSTEVLPNLQTEEEVAAGSKGGPLQDRAAMALADTIYVLFVRSKGHIERLLTERLNDDQYPTATVS